MPNDHYSGHTAPLTSKRCILYIYSTNTGTEYFKHGIYSPFLVSSKCSLFHNSNIFGSCFIHILYTGCAKIKKNNSGTKRLLKGCSLCLKTLHDLLSIALLWFSWTGIVLFYIFAAPFYIFAAPLKLIMF